MIIRALGEYLVSYNYVIQTTCEHAPDRSSLEIMKNIIRKSQTKGFTLIEVLLYLSLTVILLGTLSMFLITFLQARVKNQTISEVDGQAVQALQIITQSIRNSESITLPVAGASGAALELVSSDPLLDPIEFDLSSGLIQITENNGTSLDLTTDRIAVSNLLFENLTAVGTPGNVRISFDIDHINYSGRNEYSYSKAVQGSASLRGGSDSVVTPPTPSDEADSLAVNIASATIGGGGNKELRGLTVENTSGTDITIDTITVTWSNGQLIEEIRIDNNRIWKHNNEGDPNGRQSTGTEIDVVDYVLAAGTTEPVTKIKFNGNMTGDTFTVLFTMSDASTNLITGIAP